MRIRHQLSILGLLTFALAIAPAVSFAQALDTPTLSAVSVGHGKARLTITAGPSGAPNGFEVCYMTASDYAARGGWPASGWWPEEGWVTYTGIGTLNTWGSAQVDFKLGAGQSVDVEIGDANGETGVSGTIAAELADATNWVICVFAVGGNGFTRSVYSANIAGTTTTQGENCTFTIGYWKNHPETWPVASLQLGSVVYNAAQLLSILNQPVAGNGLVSMAHQLIGAKLNIANGANPTSIAATITAADAQIGALVVPPVGAGYLSPASTSAKTQTLDDFNNGLLGPDHCGSTPAKTSTWGGVKQQYR
jgi:hypothetical protein